MAKYKFMNFKGTKNIMINGGIILVILGGAFFTGRASHSRECSCNGSQSPGTNSTSTIGTSAKYEMPPATQQQFVVRRSIGLLSAKAA